MNASTRKLRVRRVLLALLFVGLGAILSLGAFAAWWSAYPDDGDPKNIYYVLWKHGLNSSMNIDIALGTMTHDVSPVRQVQGLTKDQLKIRFGYVRTLEEVTPYYQACYSIPGSIGFTETQGKTEDVLFLRDGPWMVVMKNGRAADLVLCKGY